MKPLTLQEDAMNEYDNLLQAALKAAKSADREILDVYSKDFEVEYKEDESPLTEADRKAHNIIKFTLEKTGLPILSEESDKIPCSERQQWTRYWLVDPLDGTKQFVQKNGQFTVNIALIENGQSILGVATIPVEKKLYWAIKGEGAWRQNADETVEQIHISNRQNPIRVVASLSHLNEETKHFIEKLNNTVELIQTGSSKKVILIAEGSADIYPRLAPTMEWDTAAVQIILEESGGTMLAADNSKPLVYNKEDLHNPQFIVSN